MLLIAAGKVPDEYHAGTYIRSGSPASVRLWVADGAGHADALARRPAEWERRVAGFLDAALG